MKTNYRNWNRKALVLAVQGALAVMIALPIVAQAEGEDEIKALTHPTNTLQIGLENTSSSSAKFGEYNGLNKSGIDLIGNLSVRGGDAYDQGSGTKRWAITGNDLGTTSRDVSATLSDQGSWKIGVSYDELRHYLTDSYQTPMQGSMGGNSFTLPQAFGVIDTKNKPAAVSGVIPPYGTQSLTANQNSYFHNEDVYSGRKNAKFSAGYNFDRQWDVQLDYNRLTQDGAKLISAATDGNLTNGLANVGAEKILMLMNPTNYQTDTVNLALNWVGEAGHFTGAYYFSKFNDSNNSVSFSNPYFGLNGAAGNNKTGTAPTSAFPVDMLSTAPSNDFHQLNLKGGYDITPTTKVVGGFSYGRNTQNESFINADQMVAGGLPQTSLNGLVITTHADVKLTNKTTQDLTLTAGLKYNERDNRTASNTYRFNDLGAAAVTSISTPLSNKSTQFELAGDYRIDKRQNIHLGYEYEQINRWCNSTPSAAQILAATTGLGSGAGNIALASAYYALGTSCVQVPESTENKLVANYRLKASDDVNFNAGYAYSRRNADVNPAFYNPMQGQQQGFELPGYVAFFDASRTEQLLKAGVNWQASEKLNMSMNGRYINDNYDSTLGVQTGHTWSVNLDAAYNIAENTLVSAYFSFRNRERDLLNDAWSHTAATYNTTAIQPWTNNLSEDDTTVGVNAKHGGLMGGKLDLAADLTYSLSKSTYSTAVNYVNAACTAPSNSGYACGTLPDIRSALVQFKLMGNYKLDKASNVLAGYTFQHLSSDDYYYNAYQSGYTATSMIPTNQQSPSYSVNLLYVAYSYSFR